MQDGPEVARGGDARFAEDDHLPGEVTGGGAFTFAAGGRGSHLSVLPLVALFVLAARRGRKARR